MVLKRADEAKNSNKTTSDEVKWRLKLSQMVNKKQPQIDQLKKQRKWIQTRRNQKNEMHLERKVGMELVKITGK